MKARYLVDAGVILRLLRGDHPQHSAQAVALFNRAEAGEFVLEITEVAAAEVVWVLTSFYKTPRAEAASALLKLLGNPGVSAGNAPWLIDACEDLRDLNVDAADCWLAANGRRNSKPVVSFERDFRKFAGLKWLTPDGV